MTAPHGYQYDVFISYSHRDGAWVRNNLLPVLEALALRVCVDFREFEPGAPSVLEIRRAIQTSRKTLLVLTPDYFESSWSVFEALIVQTIDPPNRERRLIPLLKAKCNLPPEIAYLTYVDFVDSSRLDVEWKKLLGALGVTQHQTSRSEIATYEVVTTPVLEGALAPGEERKRAFIGRQDATEATTRFIEQHAYGYFIFSGPPGQGKTALARHLASSHGYLLYSSGRPGGRADARTILRSLLAQLIPLAEVDLTIPDSIGDMAAKLEELLGKVVTQQGRVVVVIDGLDEAAEGVRDVLPFVASTPPVGLYVIITSHEGECLESLEDDLSTIPYQLFPLRPLSPAEIQEMLRVVKPTLTAAELEQVVVASEGNPLYVEAVADELAQKSDFDLENLPNRIEGFFKRATAGVRETSNEILLSTLGCLAVSKRPLSVRELSAITGVKQRLIDREGIRPIRQFLHAIDDTYSFYHARFHEFVTREVIYEDDLQEYHRKMVDWLSRPENAASTYRLEALAYHLFESAQYDTLLTIVNVEFLGDKVQAFGYAVLEDVELLVKSALALGDPRIVERSLGIIEGLRDIVGGDIVQETALVIRPRPMVTRPGRVVLPAVPRIPGLDVFVGLVPKIAVSADFYEIVPIGDRLVIAIGDAPSVGLRSAFVARCIANLFRRLVKDTPTPQLAEVLANLRSTVAGHEYFERVTMQCVDLDPARGVMAIVSAAHPFPVLYSARRGQCDRLPVKGGFLYSSLQHPKRFEQYHVEIAPGDVLVMLSDGLLGDQVHSGERYGYRFMRVIEQLAGRNAKIIGQAILDDWGSLSRQSSSDDVTLIVVSVRD